MNRFRPSPLLLAAALSACVYQVQPSQTPPIKPTTAAPIPIVVGVMGQNAGADWRMKEAARRGASGVADALVVELLHTGMFRDVRNAASGGSFDLVVAVSEKPDRTMHAFFPWFLPFCDPLIIGCLPIVPIDEKFTNEVVATAGTRTYRETGQATLSCKGPCGCAPASDSDPQSRTAAAQDAAVRIASAMMKDTSYFRTFVRAPVDDAAPAYAPAAPAAAPGAEAEPASRPAPAAAPANGAKPWWQQ